MHISNAQALDYLTHFAATIVCLRNGRKEAGWVLLHLLVIDLGLFGLSIYLSGHPKPYPAGAARAAFFLFTSMYLAPPIIVAAGFPTRITSWVAHLVWAIATLTVYFRYPSLRGKDLWTLEMLVMAFCYLAGILAAVREVIRQRVTTEVEILAALVAQGILGLALSLVLGIEYWWVISTVNVTCYIGICIRAMRAEPSRSTG